MLQTAFNSENDILEINLIIALYTDIPRILDSESIENNSILENIWRCSNINYIVYILFHFINTLFKILRYKSGYCFKNEKVTTMFAINKIDEASLVSMAYDFEPQVNLTFFSEHYD